MRHTSEDALTIMPERQHIAPSKTVKQKSQISNQIASRRSFEYCGQGFKPFRNRN
jgi:hypothetical protein